MNRQIDLRYAFVFWFRNPAALDDKFWILFINVWVDGFAIINQVARKSSIPNPILLFGVTARVARRNIFKPKPIFG
jgi:hypothetical protein